MLYFTDLSPMTKNW